MNVRVYPDGHGDKSRTYPLDPKSAALTYCAEHESADDPVDLVVVPDDDEARAIDGWHNDGTDPDPLFRLFSASPVTTWTAREVDTFNRYSK